MDFENKLFDNLRSYIKVQRYIGVLSGVGDVEGFYEGAFADVLPYWD